jgi:hypothetical protein
MKRNILVGLEVVLLLVGCLSTLVFAEPPASRNKVESRRRVLSHEEFASRFADHPDLPRTDADALALAEKLYPPADEERDATAGATPICGTPQHGVLDAARRNPAISPATRRAVDHMMAAGMPKFDKVNKRIGHFVFYYCTANPDPRHNVRTADIQALATALNKYWAAYAKRFDEPAHYVRKVGRAKLKLIDIYVYALPPDREGNPVYGFTRSEVDYIRLNSLVVRDACKRLTTSAHELFHRVQYTYGYEDGPAGMD